MSTTEMNDVFTPTLAPGSSVRLPMNPSTGAVMIVFARLIFSSSRRDLRLFQLRHRELELRLRRLIARVGIVERLAGQQVALEEALRALHVVLRELQVGLALANGRLRHVEGRLRLLDLLDDFAIFDLRDRLAAANRIAQLDVHRVETALAARHRVDRRGADEVADDRDRVDHVLARDRRELDRHRRARAAAESAAATAKPPPPMPPPPPPPTLLRVRSRCRGLACAGRAGRRGRP